MLPVIPMVEGPVLFSLLFRLVVAVTFLCIFFSLICSMTLFLVCFTASTEITK
ncbi:hypothetical protein LINGRAHAP2_LOCUS19680 [Linum grandiflorum]